jgi:hypothetical protein
MGGLRSTPAYPPAASSFFLLLRPLNRLKQERLRPDALQGHLQEEKKKKKETENEKLKKLISLSYLRSSTSPENSLFNLNFD